MSLHAIHHYQHEVAQIIRFGGTRKETAIRTAFHNLLNEYAKQKGLRIVTEVTIKTQAGKSVTPDGTLKDAYVQDWGYWESKDESDILDDEIKKKFDKGYPKENILFEDSQTAVLIQNGIELARVSFEDIEGLHKLLTSFISFERPEVRNFRKAIEHFKEDIPKVTKTIRSIIVEAEKGNASYLKAAEVFLKLCQESINSAITIEDVREMIIQHILTEDIFNTIFDETQFHRENNIARELESVIHTFFTGSTRRMALGSIQHYYQAINAAAAGIADHHEKQKFLKVVYETFYKSYNPNAAQRLGVVYTPNEVVRFMVESTDYLLHKHFNKFLEDKNVEILDPATGTGTFICDIIDYLRKEKLEYKYRNEMHANEVAILPYYISNLNIEFTYTQKMGKYAEFKNLCFVDTLDNVAGLNEAVSGIHTKYKVQGDLFAISTENSQRIIDQNRKPISVIIGNPPYFANQENENDNNKSREYAVIDQRIKDTFIKYSTAQKTKVYDMYARFYRWAFDRVNDKGIIAFITNNSFINKRTFDGFRKCVQDEFQYAYIIDLGGNITDLSGKDGIFLNEKHTIFGKAAAVGIAVMFLIKDSSRKKEKCRIHYIHPTDIRATREEKIEFLSETRFRDIPFEIIRPDKKNNWIDLIENDFEDFIPLISKQGKNGDTEKVLFKVYSTGINSGRDEWVIDKTKEGLNEKMSFYISEYNKIDSKTLTYNQKIKWSRNIKEKLRKGKTEQFNDERIVEMAYRPFTKNYLYNSQVFVDERGNSNEIFGQKLNLDNIGFGITGPNSQKPFLLQAINFVNDYHFVGSASSTQFIPLYRYNSEGKRTLNLTQWGINRFIEKYGKKLISSDGIFHYVYALLHNPCYRKKYELNLKREFPRIPLYKDFQQWADWGKQLMDLHLHYETIQPYLLTVHDRTLIPNPKVKLKADKEKGIIIIDENTLLEGIPKEAWTYKLGNRSALEWVLDQYKESKPKDPTIAEKFNNYKFSNYKEQVIDLLKRVCTVSVKTMEIVNSMEKVSELTTETA